VFDRSRVVESNKGTRPIVGYPVQFHAAKIEPEMEGVSNYLQYYATQVMVGDAVRDSKQVLGMEQTYSQLRREVGGVMDMCLEDAKAELKAQLELRQEGKLVPFFDTDLSDQLDYETGFVERVTASYLLVKFSSTGHQGLQILQSGVEITELARDRAKVDKELEVGDQVYCNAVLMDVTKPAQYLCTAVWKTESQPGPRRDKLYQAAIDLYHTLALSLPTMPDLSTLIIPDLGNMDFSSGIVDMEQLAQMSGFLVPSMSSGGGMDDIAAGDDDDLAVGDDDDDIAIVEEEKEKRPKFGLKIASFGKF